MSGAGCERVVVVGGGVGGLSAAIALARAGHQVTVLERDALPATPDVEAAFEAERRGAPQVHQTHGFLARVSVELRRRLPDVYDALMAAGVSTMSGAATFGDPRPGDEDLRILVVRRTTFEWVLRTAALAEPGVAVRGGVVVAGLVAGDPTGPGGVPVVTGVRLADGSVVDADVVVASNGRRSDVPGWLAGFGVDVPETVHESGLMYLSRWYRTPPTESLELDPKLGGDLGFVKYLAVPGDGSTLSVTLAIKPDDSPLRAALSDPGGFEAACRALPGPDRFFGGGLPLEPLGGVRPMGGLLNRLRRFTDDAGAPTVLGLHAIGDAHTCTNPLYGRGCSIALVQAGLLADAFAAHPGDAVARAAAYEAASKAEVEPWYDMSVQMDRAGADPAGRAIGGGDGGRSPLRGLGAVFAAAATDPVLGRAFARIMNLLAKPAEVMADPEVMARVAQIMASGERVELARPAGPTREELLELLAA